jgi:hypothetical protein
VYLVSVEKPDTPQDQDRLERSVSLFQATVYGVGIILGAGIYALIGEAAGIAGNAIWVSFIIAALIARVCVCQRNIRLTIIRVCGRIRDRGYGYHRRGGGGLGIFYLF